MNKTESILDVKVDQKTVRKSALNSVVIQMIFKLKGLITVPIMTYYLKPQEMGIYNIITVTAYLLYPIFSLNLIAGPSIYLIQEKSKERIREMYNTIVNGSILFYLISTIIFWLVMYKSGGKYYRYLYLVLPLMYSTLIYLSFACVLMFFHKTTILVRISFYKDLAGVILTILIVIAGASYYGMIFVVVFTDIIAGIYIYRLIKKDLPYKIFIDRKILHTFLKMSLPLLPVVIFSWVIQSSDSYFLAYFKGEETVGKYSVIYGLSNVILILHHALNLFWNPVSGKLWIEDKEKYRKAFISIFAFLTAFLFLAVLLFEFNSKLIMQFLVKRADYQDAYTIMGLIAFAFAMQVLITLLTAPLYSNRNPAMIFISYLVGSLINTVLNFVLIPPYGIWGAAISTAVSYFIVVSMMTYLNYRTAKFPFLDKRLFYIGSLFIVLWIGLARLREQLPLSQVLIGNIVLLLSLGAFLFFLILRQNEKEYFYSFFKELRAKISTKA